MEEGFEKGTKSLLEDETRMKEEGHKQVCDAMLFGGVT